MIRYRITTSGLTLLLLTLILPSPANAFLDASQPEQAAMQHWLRVLEDFANNKGEIDFQRLALYPEDLYAYTAFLSAYSPKSHPTLFPTTEHALAYYINAYNALSIKGLLDYQVPEKLKGVTAYRFFSVSRHTLGGERITLKSLRKDYVYAPKEPRAHFAVSSHCVSCPILSRTPYLAATLNEQLDRATQQYLNNSEYVTVSHQEKILWLSEYFADFSKDILGSKTALMDFINPYLTQPIPKHYPIRFMPDDWHIRQIKRR